jgi:hypothetical protein
MHRRSGLHPRWHSLSGFDIVPHRNYHGVGNDGGKHSYQGDKYAHPIPAHPQLGTAHRCTICRIRRTATRRRRGHSSYCTVDHRLSGFSSACRAVVARPVSTNET